MNFKLWVENEIDGKSADMTPASSQVIKSGLQPQVDSSEISTHQKDESDKMQALDSHFQRIATILPTIGHQSEKLVRISNFCKKVLSAWEEIKMDDSMGTNIQVPSYADPDPRKIQWMKDNQPLPEPLKSAGGAASF